MPYRKEQFANNEIYHIVLRALDNNLLFKDIDDYYRGIFSIYEFNDINPATIRERRKARELFKKSLKEEAFRCPTSVKSIKPEEFLDQREKLVEILTFCFMPNHLHLLLRQLKEESITKFMRKLGTGYGKYFNEKYARKGHVFQDTFKSVHIEDENQLRTGFVYIHTNSIAIIESGWKEIGIKEPEKAIEFIENYKWSSYQDYLGKKNFPSVTDRDFLLEVMGGINGCRNSVNDWVKYKGEIREFSGIALE